MRRAVFEEDKGLEHYLNLAASHMPRNTDLPFYLKKKAESWCNKERPDWTDSERLHAYAIALKNVMDGSVVDVALTNWLRNRGGDRVKAINAMIAGQVPKKGPGYRWRAWFSTRWADRYSVRNAETVLPPAK
jgi:hypothetical protein